MPPDGGRTREGPARHLRLDELDFEADGNILADEDAARFERRVPGEAEVLAVDFCRGGKSYAQIAPGVLGGRAEALNLEGHGPCDAMQGQVAGHGEIAAAFGHDLGRLEGHGGELFDVKEIPALQVA